MKLCSFGSLSASTNDKIHNWEKRITKKTSYFFSHMLSDLKGDNLNIPFTNQEQLEANPVRYDLVLL